MSSMILKGRSSWMWEIEDKLVGVGRQRKIWCRGGCFCFPVSSLRAVAQVSWREAHLRTLLHVTGVQGTGGLE